MQSLTQEAARKEKINLDVQIWPILATKDKLQGNHKYRKVNQDNLSKKSLPNSLD